MLERCAPFRRVSGRRTGAGVHVRDENLLGLASRSKVVRKTSRPRCRSMRSCRRQRLPSNGCPRSHPLGELERERASPQAMTGGVLERCQQGARNPRTARHATCRARCCWILTFRAAEVAEFRQRIGRSSSLDECRRMRVSPAGISDPQCMVSCITESITRLTDIITPMRAISDA